MLAVMTGIQQVTGTNLEADCLCLLRRGEGWGPRAPEVQK